MTILALLKGDTSYVTTEEQRTKLIAEGRANVELVPSQQSAVDQLFLRGAANHPPLVYQLFESAVIDGELTIIGDPIPPAEVAVRVVEDKDYIAIRPMSGG